jgi:uncharacterized protein involved in exopolysaccharide biosynthesis
MTEHLQAAPQLRDYLGVLGRRKWVMLMPLVVVPLVAVLLSMREQPVYQDSAEVLLPRRRRQKCADASSACACT